MRRTQHCAVVSLCITYPRSEQTARWYQLATDHGRAAHCAALLPSGLYILGGRTEAGVLDSVCRLVVRT